MDKLVLIPMVLSFVLLARGKQPQDVFLIVFLPSLTLLPVYYDSKTFQKFHSGRRLYFQSWELGLSGVVQDMYSRRWTWSFFFTF